MDSSQPTKSLMTRLALGSEEFALALCLINRPDLGQSILATMYEGITEEQANSFLNIASHSLLARGLSTVSGQMVMVLDSELERAVFPLARYDSILLVNLLQDGNEVETTIHLVNGRMFTAHFSHLRVVHILEHGTIDHLDDYLPGLFLNFGQERIGDPVSLPLPLKVMQQVRSLAGISGEASKLLVQNGWTASQADMLEKDIQQPVFWGSVIHILANSEMPPDQYEQSKKRPVFVLRGIERSWLFSFPELSEAAQGYAMLAAHQDFEQVLAELIAWNSTK